jgi:hypothetical protein
MSHVTAALLLCSSPLDVSEEDVLARVNGLECLNGQKFAQLSDAMGPMHPQALVMGAGFKNMPIPELVKQLRALPWEAWGCNAVQLVLQDEHDCGFGMVQVYQGEYYEPFDAVSAGVG